MKQANFLYFYIACLFRKYPWNEPQNFSPRFNRMIVPMALGMILAMGVGTLLERC